MKISLPDVFTDDAMNRPLFEEPTEASERDDPWPGPQGFMIGGMCDLSGLANQLNDLARARDGAPAQLGSLLAWEISRIDPGSTAFRYAENYNSTAKRRTEVHGELYVNVPHLQRAMLALYAALNGALPEIAENRTLEAPS